MARTTTKAPAPKNRLKNERAEALARMTKAELVKTVKTLDARVVKLLNQLQAKSNLVATDAVIWCRCVDGSGSMHPCFKNDEGAIGFVPLSPQLYNGALRAALHRLPVKAESAMAQITRIELPTRLETALAHQLPRVTAKELRAAAESVGLDMSALPALTKYPWEK